MKTTRDVLLIIAVLGFAFFLYAQFSGTDDGSDSTGILDLSDDDSDLGDLDSPSSDVTGGIADMSVTKSQLTTTWAQLIQHFEGFFPGSRSYRNNNPGNLVMQGDLGTDADGYAKFSSYEAGFAALVSDLTAKLRKYPGFSISQIMARYAPSPDGTLLNAGNNPTKYAANIASGLSSFFGSIISPSTTLKQLTGMTEG